MENKSDSDSDKSTDDKKDKKKILKAAAINQKKNNDTPMLPGTDAPDSNIISADAAKKEDFEVGRRKNGASKIDYAATIEDAYDDLNKILGSDGIKRLTSDTQGLMKQQMELAKSMKAMTPLVQGMAPMIGQMQEMMKTMDGNGEGGLGGVMEIAKKLAASTNQ
jgi:hypothetical protein